VTWQNSNTDRAVVSTTDAKFGNSSLARQTGSGSPAGGLFTTSLAAPVGAFTAEFFIKFTALSPPDNRFFLLGETFQYLELTMTGGNFAMGVAAPPVASAIAVSTGVWYHIAASFDGTTVRLFVNGALAVSIVGNPVGTPFVISPGCAYGRNGDSTNHYLDEFRYTDGIARYTSAFTPPSSAFPDN